MKTTDTAEVSTGIWQMNKGEKERRRNRQEEPGSRVFFCSPSPRMLPFESVLADPMESR